MQYMDYANKIEREGVQKWYIISVPATGDMLDKWKWCDNSKLSGGFTYYLNKHVTDDNLFQGWCQDWYFELEKDALIFALTWGAKTNEMGSI